MTERRGPKPHGHGARVAGGRTHFAVWAPAHERVHLAIDPRDGGERIEMAPRDGGWHTIGLGGDRSGLRYGFALSGASSALPDPASRSQPEGVHGPSAVVGDLSSYGGVDAWRGRPLSEYVIAEIHVGTFSEDGTFDAAIEHLDELVDVGITAVEVMPIAQFPGGRNWGYDGVFPYAAQNTYGGPHGFRRFVDAAHRVGLCVVLDVVYNHLGPEGNVLPEYGPYFTSRYRTPWGDALAFDGPDRDAVRAYFVDNALQWLDEFGVDALRLDAVHAIIDESEYPFVEQLSDAVRALADRTDRHVYTIAEVGMSTSAGVTCDARWRDEFHHALHALLTGERFEYYADFGAVTDLATAYRAHDGSAARFVVFAQNHDQIGNRALGERLSALVDTDGLMVAAATVLLSPFVPLLFMGEEYGETSPFPYFTSHGDPALVDAVRHGRAEEFAESVGGSDVPDPQDEALFRAAKLDRRQREKEPHATLLDWHRRLLALRRSLGSGPTAVDVDESAEALVVRRGLGDEAAAIVLLTFADRPGDVVVRVALDSTPWRTVLDSHPGLAPATFDAATTVELRRPPRSVLVLTHAS